MDGSTQRQPVSGQTVSFSVIRMIATNVVLGEGGGGGGRAVIVLKVSVFDRGTTVMRLRPTCR